MNSWPILVKIGETIRASNEALVGTTAAVEYREATMVGVTVEAMGEPQPAIRAAMRLPVGKGPNPEFGGIGVQLWRDWIETGKSSAFMVML